MIFCKHISDASGICLNLGGLHGALHDLDYGDLRVLDLEDGGGQLLERVVTVASPLLSDRRPNAGRLCRKFLKGQDKICPKLFLKINLIFLLNIVRILVSKLQADSTPNVDQVR